MKSTAKKNGNAATTATTPRTKKLPAKRGVPTAEATPKTDWVEDFLRDDSIDVQPAAIPRSGLKHDTGKLRYDLIPSDALAQIARVLTYGADKYTPHNWRKGIADSRLYSATLRHLEAWREGETTDAESGCYHLAHAACCVLFALSAELGGAVLIDDLREGQPR